MCQHRYHPQFVHGLSIPVGKLGFHLPRTLSNAVSSDRDASTDGPTTSFSIRTFTEQSLPGILRNRHAGGGGSSSTNTANPSSGSSAASGSTAGAANLLPRPIYRIGGSVIRSKSGCQQQQTQQPPAPPPPRNQPPSQPPTSQSPSPALPVSVDEAARGGGGGEEDATIFSSEDPAAVLGPRHTEGQELQLGPRTITFADGSRREAGTANAEREV